MPCLDAKALENDPDGMAFLRSVLRPEAGEVRSRVAEAADLAGDDRLRGNELADAVSPLATDPGQPAGSV